MTVVTVPVTDSTPKAQKWEMPGNYQGLRSPIPRGLVTFAGSEAIATLSAGDETAYNLTVVLPPGFAYLLKVCSVRYVSSDLEANFGLIGHVFYSRARDLLNNQFTIICPGEAINAAVVATLRWAPEVNAPKLVLQGGDSMGARLSDMDAGGSSSGVMHHWWQFYVFDVDQVDKWEVNTPIPVISHTSF